MTHIFIIILSIFFYEFFNLFNFKELIKEYFLILKNLKKNINKKKFSDLDNEKYYINTSKNLLLVSLKILFIFVPIIIFFILLNLYSNDLFKFFISIKGILISLVTIILYFYLMKNND